MEIKHIKELMAAMGRTGTKKLTLKKEGLELQLEREENGVHKGNDFLENEDVVNKNENALQRASMAFSKGKEISASSSSLIAVENESQEKEGVFITSPMVGTFYAASSPDDPTFVKVGDKIEKHHVVCIIEAMKVMNEVKAGVSGTIAEVLVENGHPVEFGTKLFRVT